MTAFDQQPYQLEDRFRAEEGRVFMSGVQAAARLPLDQLRIDSRRGLRTAAFVSGYQGSPLGSFGVEAAAAAATLPDLPVRVSPALNEELAATSVMGSQIASTLEDCTVDGILGVWFGKAPGLDRAGDAVRHGIFAGAAPRGGVVAMVGDDPAAKSSTLPSSSEATMVGLRLPILHPGSVQQVIDLSRHAVAISRATGMWVGVRLVTAVADGTGVVDVDLDRVHPRLGAMLHGGTVYVPEVSGHLLTPRTLQVEEEMVAVRERLVLAYSADNHLNRVTVRSADDWCGIAAGGHTHAEVREALALLGLGDDRALQAAGIRLLQVAMPWPLEASAVREFATGLSRILVVEEKTTILEDGVRNLLYPLPERPQVLGRRDARDQVLLSASGTLGAEQIASALRRVLADRLGDRLPPEVARRASIPLLAQRSPFYCSGCPHNRSTRTAPGTLVGGGIGCHSMVGLMDAERVGDVVSFSAMGTEGAQWIGMAPFIGRDHLVQNIGDGTFFHSGSLALRAAADAGVNITYRLLYNGTVAMTGGQDAVGARSVIDTARLAMLEGARRVIIVSDDPSRHRAVRLPAGVDLWGRQRVDEALEVLAAVPGVTVLIYDQPCAAELRRDRSRGRAPQPTERVVINERVCEGCGDCGAKSNCLSVQPVPTPFGRKTRIHQSSCNLDMTCIDGDCPSFALVEITSKAGSRSSVAGEGGGSKDWVLPEPSPVVDPNSVTVRLSGIGGTGVVTVSQVLGTAAMLDGFEVSGMDQTGLSQKAGPVMSDLRIGREAVTGSSHAPAGAVDVMLAFDLLVAASATHRIGAGPDRTVLIASAAQVPTGQMVLDPGQQYPDLVTLRQVMDPVSRSEHNRYIDVAALCEGLFGTSMPSNMMLVGVAHQAGTLPVDAVHIERAIELNGVAVSRNIAAFRWGRRYVVEPQAVLAAAGLATSVEVESTEEEIRRLAADLQAHSGRGTAVRFEELIHRVREVEQARCAGSERLTLTVARSAHRLMAYKDEYEVARLLLLEESRAAYREASGGSGRVTLLLHPPVLRALGMKRKIRLRRSAPILLRMLRAGRILRGTWLDPFRFGEVRRHEREMIPEFLAAVEQLCAGLMAESLDEAVAIAELPDSVRGYEHLKITRAVAYRDELAQRLAGYTSAAAGQDR